MWAFLQSLVSFSVFSFSTVVSMAMSDSDFFASDNESNDKLNLTQSIGSLNLAEPAPPVDFASSADFLTAEVQRLAQVVASFSQRGRSSTESLVSVSNEILTLQKGQQEILSLLKSGTGAVRCVGVQNVTERTSEERRVDSSAGGQNLSVTVQGADAETSATSQEVSQAKARALFVQMKDFDLKQASSFCTEKNLDIVAVASKLRRTFPKQRKVWFRATRLIKEKKWLDQKKTKGNLLRKVPQTTSSTSKARK